MALDVEAFPVATSRAHHEAARVPQAGTWLVCLMAHEDDGWRIVERLALPGWLPCVGQCQNFLRQSRRK